MNQAVQLQGEQYLKVLNSSLLCPETTGSFFPGGGLPEELRGGHRHGGGPHGSEQAV